MLPTARSCRSNAGKGLLDFWKKQKGKKEREEKKGGKETFNHHFLRLLRTTADWVGSPPDPAESGDGDRSADTCTGAAAGERSRFARVLVDIAEIDGFWMGTRGGGGCGTRGGGDCGGVSRLVLVTVTIGCTQTGGFAFSVDARDEVVVQRNCSTTPWSNLTTLWSRATSLVSITVQSACCTNASAFSFCWAVR